MSPFRRRLRLLDSTHEGVLGTRLTLKVSDRRPSVLRESERILLAEIDRLESIFSVFRPDSELNRWKDASPDAPVSAELSELLAVALRWWTSSQGVFNPAVGMLSARWKAAEEAATIPDAGEMQALAASIRDPPYRFDGSRPIKTGDCSSLNFNALAKGMIVDRACAALVEQVAPASVIVNVGGDLVHHGAGRASVRIEDPHRPFDNAAPLRTVVVANSGVATSGSTKRGVRVGGNWFSHVIDPRTGWPVDAIVSASVIARDAATADAVATVVSVLPAAEGIAFVDGLGDGIACLVVGADRSVSTNASWERQQAT